MTAVAPALPVHAYPQQEITATLGGLLARSAATRRTLERLHASSGVETRHLALPLQEYAGLTSFGRANDHFIAVGTDLAEQAARSAMDAAGVDPREVDFLLFTSVTGISAPSIDAALVHRLGMRYDVKRLPSFGLGCVAGAAGLARVHDYLTGHPEHTALLVCLELCSLTIQHGDDSMANLVSSGLFGDGAAAAVLVGDARSTRPGAPSGPQVVDTRSRLYPGTAQDLGWDIGDTGFRILLSAGLPSTLAAHLNDDVTALLEDHDLKVRDVTGWVVHAGGPRVLDAVRDALDLDAGSLAASWESLAAVGNLSSASVLDVLARSVQQPHVPASPGVLMAFGPGVSTELVLLRWPGEA